MLKSHWAHTVKYYILCQISRFWLIFFRCFLSELWYSQSTWVVPSTVWTAAKKESDRTMKHTWSLSLKRMCPSVLSLWSHLSATGWEIESTQVFWVNEERQITQKKLSLRKYEAEFNLKQAEGSLVMISLVIVGIVFEH